MKIMFSAALAVALSAGAASAQSIVQTADQLADVNGQVAGGSTASTTTNDNGRLTVVTGNARYANPFAPREVWQQQNVGGGGAVGITGGYPRNGNGSAFFSGFDGNSKSDLEIHFSQPVALSTVTGLSYDAYRLGTSTASAHLVNSLRMLIGDAQGVYTGTYLIFEPVYNGFPVVSPIEEDRWYTFDITGASTLWANNGNLTEPAGAGTCRDCYASLDAWSAANPGFTVLGLSTGIGSGFNGIYGGAVDNVRFATTAGTKSWNFEVTAAAAAVPEPATWALMILGFGAVGGALRRRRAAAAFA